MKQDLKDDGMVQNQSGFAVSLLFIASRRLMYLPIGTHTWRTSRRALDAGDLPAGMKGRDQCD